MWRQKRQHEFVGGRTRRINCHLSPSESRPRRWIWEFSALWSSTVYVVQCKDGGAADVALLLLMWPLPIRWALPYGSYCQPRGSGLSWLMLIVDTPNSFQMGSNNKKVPSTHVPLPWTQPPTWSRRLPAGANFGHWWQQSAVRSEHWSQKQQSWPTLQ